MTPSKHSAWVVILVVLLLSASVWLLRSSFLSGSIDTREDNPASQLDHPDGDAVDVAHESHEPERADLTQRTREVQVDRDLDLMGTVINTNGHPIAGASINTRQYPTQRSDPTTDYQLDEFADGPSTISSRDGSFSLRMLREDVVDLHVASPDYAPRVVPSCQAGQHVAVILDAPSHLVVSVLSPEGITVPDALVTFWRTDDLQVTQCEHREQRTDTTGKVTFTDLSSGNGQLRCEHIDFGILGWPRAIDVPIEVNSSREISITFTPVREVHGQVIDAQTGDPISGACVGVEWLFHCAVTTDANGLYRLRGCPKSGGYDLYAKADGYAQHSMRPNGPRADFSLSAGDRVIGRVVDSHGMPVVDSLISVVAKEARRTSLAMDHRSCKSEQDGGFIIDCLRTDLAHTLVAEKLGHGRQHLNIAPHPDAPGTINVGDITLPVPLRIEGLCTSSSGIPVAGAVVALEGHNADRNRLHVFSDLPTSGNYFSATQLRYSDDLGHFRFNDLSPGNYILTMWVDQKPEATHSLILVDADLLGVILSPNRVGSIRCHVVDTAGRAVPDASIIVYSGSLVHTKTHTDSMGLARLESLPSYQARLRVSCRGYLPTATSPDDSKEVTIELQSAAVIKGMVIDESGSPLSEMLVCARAAEGGATFRSWTNHQGAFSIEVPSGARFDLDVSSRRYIDMSSKVPTVRQVHSRHVGQLLGIAPPAFNLVIEAKEKS